MAEQENDLIGTAGRELKSQEAIEEWFQHKAKAMGADPMTKEFAAYLGMQFPSSPRASLGL